MNPENLFSKEILNDYLKKIRSESNRSKSQNIITGLEEWLNWLKSNKLISSKDYSYALKEISNLSNGEKRKTATENSNKISKDPFHFSFFNYKFILIALVILSLLFNLYLFNNFKTITSTLSEKNSAGRVLPFKGSIKGTDGNPLDTKRDAIFVLYDVPTGGKELYTGKCIGESALEPTFNGSFTILIGSDCGMKPIPESIFEQNDTLYLGVTIGSESELSPRYQIFTSTFSRDTGKLQGLPLGKGKSSIPFINDEGFIELDSESPSLKSTKGELSIEGNSLHLKSTEEKGNIIFDPALGSNVIITTGKLGIGTFAPTSSLDVSDSSLFNSVVDFRNLISNDDDKTSVLKLSLGTPVDGRDSNFVEFYADASEDKPGTKVGDIRINNNGVVFESKGADFAEYFKINSDQELLVNNIVSLSPDGIHKSLPNEKIIGVVSNTAGFIGNNIYSDTDSVLVGLVGQVEVFISNINGDIKTGDKIGATTIPGYGGKIAKDKFGAGYSLETPSKTKLTSDQCPSSYKRLKDLSGKKIKCGSIEIVISLD